MSIRDKPHYEVASTELATWIEHQGTNTWWSIDGDRYLTSRTSSPCRGDELAAVLRRINRQLLISARDPKAAGQSITHQDLDRAVDRVGKSIHLIDPTLPKPSWADDRCLTLCWKGETEEWYLMEDSETTKAFRDVVTEPLRIE